MAKGKTFAPGQPLTAEDVNTFLNPNVPQAGDAQTLNWQSLTVLGSMTGFVYVARDRMTVHVAYDLSGTNTTDVAVANLAPTVPTSPVFAPCAEFQNGTLNQPAYLSTVGTLRVPAQSGTTRRRGYISYFAGAVTP